MTADLRLVGDDDWRLLYGTEFDLRDGLAKAADLCGWHVETEHVVPGWGRPDLYLRSGNDLVVAVELKLDLLTASECRKGIQQADAYRLALPEVSATFLVAAAINREVMEPYGQAYPRVEVYTAGAFIEWLRGADRGLAVRHRIAFDRFQRLSREAELSRRVLAELSAFHSSPLGAHILPGSPTPSPSVEELGAMFDVGITRSASLA